MQFIQHLFIYNFHSLFSFIIHYIFSIHFSMEDDNSLNESGNAEEDPEHFVSTHMHLLEEDLDDNENSDKEDKDKDHQSEVDTGHNTTNDTPLTRSKSKIANQVKQALSNQQQPKTIKEAILENARANENSSATNNSNQIQKQEEEDNEVVEITPMQPSINQPQNNTNQQIPPTTHEVDRNQNQQKACNIQQPTPSTSYQANNPAQAQSKELSDMKIAFQVFTQQLAQQMSKQQQQINIIAMRQTALSQQSVTKQELQFSREDHQKLEEQRKKKLEEENNKFHSRKQDAKNTKKSLRKGKTTEDHVEEKSHETTQKESETSSDDSEDDESDDKQGRPKNELERFNSPDHIPKNPFTNTKTKIKKKPAKKNKKRQESDDSDLGKYETCTESSTDEEDEERKARRKKRKKPSKEKKHDSMKRSSSTKKRKTDSKSHKNDSESEPEKKNKYSDQDTKMRSTHPSSSSGKLPSTDAYKIPRNNNNNQSNNASNSNIQQQHSSNTPTQNRIKNNGQLQDAGNKNNMFKQHDQTRNNGSNPPRGPAMNPGGQSNNQAGGGAQGGVNRPIPRQPFYPDINDWQDSLVSILNLAHLLRSINRHNYPQKLPLLCYRYNFGNTCSMRTPNQKVCYSLDRKHQFHHCCSACFEIFHILCYTHRDDNCPCKRYFQKFKK